MRSLQNYLRKIELFPIVLAANNKIADIYTSTLLEMSKYRLLFLFGDG